MDFLADTGFLIDLWREARQPGPTTRYAQANAHKQVGICWVVEGEFLSGSVLASHDTTAVSNFLGHYPVVHSNSAIVRRYGELFADLRRRNQLIGPNDLWIAAAAVSLGLPLLTRNIDEFERVPELDTIDYSALTRDRQE
ncbi:MAG: type II toxin-antitoxin system VapC family toxin [Kiritimatiellia bacterium]|jgi:tRNA(fMet)-specific endonuclease VapC|nr:type II toxin-antitoxin system VapC family toxin [Kiritimatiellia bacterium]MDP6631216.1 type II toxin-antitoxin system VapC family toxin [Kiritimatiellia bacterium]MDP6809547.1 type II toxin-antitoxin system VapC family toxin [Kiritimatiellia bacterium]MDP7023602.1 type II toxin-antitoxin system VapC family toxin [Kiritimatiellia bacterium]